MDEIKDKADESGDALKTAYEEATAEECKNAYIALYEAKNALKFLAPEAGKFYRIKSVVGWNDDAPYLGSANSQQRTVALNLLRQQMPIPSFISMAIIYFLMGLGSIL